MKKNLLTVLILALLVVNIVLTGVLMFSVMNTNKKTAQLVNNIATVMNLELTVPGEEEVEEPISMADTAVYKISSTMTIPLTTETITTESGETQSKERYILFDVTLMMNTAHEDYETYGTTLADREGMIEDVITVVVNAHTESECRNDLEGIKEEILEEIQELFQSDFIYKIGITNVKFGG